MILSPPNPEVYHESFDIEEEKMSNDEGNDVFESSIALNIRFNERVPKDYRNSLFNHMPRK